MCDNCHSGGKFVIPEKLIRKLKRSEYPVSDLSRKFLGKSFFKPLLDEGTFNPEVFKIDKDLAQVKVSSSFYSFFRKFVVKSSRWERISSPAGRASKC